MEHMESYIDQSIVITEQLPKNLQCIIEEMTRGDNAENWWMYFDRMDDLDVNAKNAYAAGMISKETWRLLYAKYISHALAIAEEEDAKEYEDT